MLIGVEETGLCSFSLLKSLKDLTVSSQGLRRTQPRPLVWETLEMFVTSLSCSLLSCRQMAKAIVSFYTACDRITVKLGTCSISGYVWCHDVVMQRVHSISHEAGSIQMLQYYCCL